MIAVTSRWMNYPINVKNRRVICRCIVILYCMHQPAVCNFTNYLFIVLLRRISRDYVMYVTRWDFYICAELKTME